MGVAYVPQEQNIGGTVLSTLFVALLVGVVMVFYTWVQRRTQRWLS